MTITAAASITEAVATPPWPWSAGDAARGAADATPVMPGVSEVTATVSMVHLIN